MFLAAALFYCRGSCRRGRRGRLRRAVVRAVGLEEARVTLFFQQVAHLGFLEVLRDRYRKAQQETWITGGLRAIQKVRIDGLGCVVSHGLAATLTKQRRAAREQQLQMIVELRHGADGGARGAHRIRLVDRDGRRNTFDRLDLGLVHAIEELPRIGRECLDVTTLAFGIQRVENERRLSGAGYARDDDELVQRNVEIEILEIVLARTAHEDGITGGVSHSFTVKVESVSTGPIRMRVDPRARSPMVADFGRFASPCERDLRPEGGDFNRFGVRAAIYPVAGRSSSCTSSGVSAVARGLRWTVHPEPRFRRTWAATSFVQATFTAARWLQAYNAPPSACWSPERYRPSCPVCAGRVDLINVPNVLGESRMNSRKMSGVALAAAAAMVFSMAAVTTANAADEGKVKCEGVNSCKGKSACKGANNSCKGQNSCKGKGYLEMSQAQCDAAKAKAGK